MLVRFVALLLPLVFIPSLFAQAKPPAGVAYERDVEYGTGAGEKLKLDIAYPEKSEKPLPCIVVIHGGGWKGGSKDAHINIIHNLAAQGYVSATVQYRFSPKHRFPAQVEDVKCAVRFLRANAGKYPIDKEKFGAVGFSAGAHLSMLLGTMGKEDGLEGEGGNADQPSQVQCVVSFFGPTDLLADDIPEGVVDLLNDLTGATKSEKPELFAAASPVTYASRGDAPMLLFQGTKDPLVPHTQAYKMADALTKADVPGRVELILGASHGFGGKEMEHTLVETVAFFAQHLKK